MQSNWCQDPSTPSENLRFSSVAQDDLVSRLFILMVVLSKTDKH